MEKYQNFLLLSFSSLPIVCSNFFVYDSLNGCSKIHQRGNAGGFASYDSRVDRFKAALSKSCQEEEETEYGVFSCVPSVVDDMGERPRLWGGIGMRTF